MGAGPHRKAGSDGVRVRVRVRVGSLPRLRKGGCSQAWRADDNNGAVVAPAREFAYGAVCVLCCTGWMDVLYRMYRYDACTLTSKRALATNDRSGCVGVWVCGWEAQWIDTAVKRGEGRKKTGLAGFKGGEGERGVCMYVCLLVCLYVRTWSTVDERLCKRGTVRYCM